MLRPIGKVVLAPALLLLMAAALPAAERAPKKDPVEAAFALPKGLVLTPAEMEWAKTKRAQLEPKLRAALEIPDRYEILLVLALGKPA